MAMGILVWSAQVRDLLGKSSLWVTGKGRVPGTGFVGLGLSVPNRLGTTICQRVVPKIVIKIVITIFFSSFNDVVLSNSMFVDCCMLCCRERDPIAAVG